MHENAEILIHIFNERNDFGDMNLLATANQLHPQMENIYRDILMGGANSHFSAQVEYI